MIFFYEGEPCEYKAEIKAGRNNRVPKNGTSTSENRNSDFRNSEQGVPKNGTFTSEIRDTNNTNNTYNTSNNTSTVQEDDDDTDFFFDAPAEHKNEYTPLDVHVSEEDNFFD